MVRRVRYKSSAQTAQTVALVVDKIDNIFAYRFVPAGVRNIYQKLKSLFGGFASRMGS